MAEGARGCGAARVWSLYAAASLRAQMHYRASFVLDAAGSFVLTGVDFLAVWALFDRFGNLSGWSLPEVGVFYGTAQVGFALAELLGGGFQQAGELVRRGELDRMLLRPRSTALQLFGHEVTLRRMGRATQGSLVLCGSLLHIEGALGASSFALLGVTIVASACLFLGLFVLQAALSIFTVQTIEVMNATTYGGVTAAHYPMSIYGRWFRGFFTYVVPLACVAYFPLVTMLGRPDPLGAPAWVGLVTPLAGPAFLALALALWSRALRAYTSTGS